MFQFFLSVKICISCTGKNVELKRDLKKICLLNGNLPAFFFSVVKTTRCWPTSCSSTWCEHYIWNLTNLYGKQFFEVCKGFCIHALCMYGLCIHVFLDGFLHSKCFPELYLSDIVLFCLNSWLDCWKHTQVTSLICNWVMERVTGWLRNMV